VGAEGAVMKRTLTYLAGVVFVGVLLVSRFTHGTGVVRDDPDRNISIPADLTVPLQVMAAYNNNRIFFRYRWPAASPGIHHDVLRYEGGEWVVHGRAVPGSQPEGLHEDRVAMMLDDGSVPEFARYGGYITIGQGLVGFSDEVDGSAVEAHPYLGEVRGQEEVSKYLPATRSVLGDWSATVSEAELNQLREAGYFIDLWHWRAQRSNPLDISDDQFVAEARHSDTGRGAYVSLPVTLGLDRDAELTAVRFNGATPAWDQEWHDVTLFYPGQVSWAMLNSARHAGASSIAEGVPVKFRHSPEQLAHYGVEVEFADEIRNQWLLTLAGGVLLIFAFGIALNGLIGRKGV
jgi:hypothetical protein